jgi:hypothetical protein
MVRQGAPYENSTMCRVRLLTHHIAIYRTIFRVRFNAPYRNTKAGAIQMPYRRQGGSHREVAIENVGVASATNDLSALEQLFGG